MKISFTAILKKFDQQGEKTGWTYITVPKKVSGSLNPGVKKTYRVKGMLDDHPIQFIALVPMGDGGFIIPVNAIMRKAIRKQKGASVQVQLQLDQTPVIINKDFLDCLADEPSAFEAFNKLAPSHRQYYSKWIEAAKTEVTKASRIATAVTTLAQKVNYGETIRSQKKVN